MKNEIEMICPECGNIGRDSGLVKEKKCFLNEEKQVWHCFQCGAKGRLSQEPIESTPENLPDFLSLSKIQKKNLKDHSEAIAYLEKRFSGDIPEFFHLGYSEKWNAISIPIRAVDRSQVGIKYRHLSDSAPQKYLSETGSQAGLFFIPGKNTDEWLFVEGEFDAMTAKILGFEGHILATQTNRISKFLKDQIKVLPMPKKIYICADRDEAGEELSAQVRALPLKDVMIWDLELPEECKDLNECLATKGRDASQLVWSEMLSACRSESERLTFDALSRISNTMEYLQNSLNFKGWSTGFKMLDVKLGGGLMPYTLTALSAPGKTGKTTFMLQLIFNMLKSGVKIGLISLEMNPVTHILPNLMNMIYKKNVRRMDADELGKMVSERVDELNVLSELRIFDGYGTVAAEILDDWIRYNAEKGTQIFFLDHVGYSLQDIKDSGEHSKLSKTLRAITREFPINIVAIVQPKGLAPDKKRVTKHDLYGSITWSQDINELLTLERSEDNQLSLRLTDSHNPLAQPSDEAILLYYDRDTTSLTE